MMTVSRAIRGVDGVSEATRARILSLAEEMGYVPNRMAGSLAAAASNLITISVPTLFDAVFAEIIEGLHGPLRHAGFETIIETSDYDPAREAAWIERMITWSPAAVVICGVDRTASARQRLGGAAIPTLELWDLTPDPIDLCVGIDHHAAGHAMGTHLATLGYRRPAYVGVTAGRDPRAEKRLAGFVQAFAEAGSELCAQYRLEGAASFESGHEGTRLALAATPRPDVLYFLNDHLAVGGLMACQAAGVDVPGEMGLAGFNALNITNALPLRLTTSATPRQAMGAKAGRLLVAAIRGVRTERTVALPVELIAGDTTHSQHDAPN